MPENSPAALQIGTRHSDQQPAHLMPGRFNRHTFWCGQSGSGKTYALGVVLEELLLRTSLPIVIFDPNADFVHLGSTVEGIDSAEADALASRTVKVLRPSHLPADDLFVRFTSMTPEAKAAVMRLDPIQDRAEFNAFLHLEIAAPGAPIQQRVAELRRSSDPALVAMAHRIENLRLLDWQVWAGDNTSATDVIAERPDATVLDLGGFASPEEPLVVALAVLDELWARREERRPVLLVIDEAHNLASPDAATPLARAVRDRLIQIAAEGRKFGLWLLLSTQRPSKVHSGILSQCDNLGLLKMSSPHDLAELGSIFGFVPGDLLQQATSFVQGQAIFAGGFAGGDPFIARMRNRLTREGGSDVKVPLRG